MAESVTQHDTDHPGNDEPEIVLNEQGRGKSEAGQDGQKQSELSPPTLPETMMGTHSSVIWTPKFIILFALVLICGLSADDLFTQGWLAGHFGAAEILSGHFLLLLILWVIATYVAHSWWLRVGTIFGCVWAMFNCINFFTALFHINLHMPNPAYLHAATSCALLGAYICLSTARTELHTWDVWFFRFAIIIGSIFVLRGYLVASSASDLIGGIASNIGAVASVLSVLVWWLRSACWHTHPGQAFLLGASPAIILLLPHPGITNGSVNFFLTQVSLLCMLLGLIRLIQGEIAR